MNRTLLALALLVLLALPSAALARIWTDSHGRKMEAKFVRVHLGAVVLSRAGRVFKVPFSNLSVEDQDYVRKQLEAKGKGDLVPAKSDGPGATGLPAGVRAVGVSPEDEEEEEEEEEEQDEPPDGESEATQPDGVPGQGDTQGNAEPERTWTDLRGRKIRARLVAIVGDQVILSKDGQAQSHPMSVFSPEDQAYLRSRQGGGARTSPTPGGSARRGGQPPFSPRGGMGPRHGGSPFEDEDDAFAGDEDEDEGYDPDEDDGFPGAGGRRGIGGIPRGGMGPPFRPPMPRGFPGAGGADDGFDEDGGFPAGGGRRGIGGIPRGGMGPPFRPPTRRGFPGGGFPGRRGGGFNPGGMGDEDEEESEDEFDESPDHDEEGPAGGYGRPAGRGPMASRGHGLPRFSGLPTSSMRGGGESEEEPSGGFAGSQGSAMQQTMGECGKCKKIVSGNLGAGSRCPHCGVRWDYEERADGTVVNASGQEVPRWWMTIGGAGGFAGIIVIVIGILVRLTRGRD